jgi:NADH:ubiquinone oxidoreductase subunit B-like Fe-S oxidoreductase
VYNPKWALATGECTLPSWIFEPNETDVQHLVVVVGVVVGFYCLLK